MAPIHHWSSYLCIMRMMTVISMMVIMMALITMMVMNSDNDDDGDGDGNQLTACQESEAHEDPLH